MAKSTFSGPVRSLAGFISAGNAAVVSLTADTSITVASHAGKILLCNDADGKFTLPSIVTTAPGEDTDPNQTNNLGAQFMFVVVTAATDMDILTDGTDKFVGHATVVNVADGTNSTFAPASSNDVISMNGGTTGGDKGSTITITALEDNVYLVEAVLIGTGTEATPFADS